MEQMNETVRKYIEGHIDLANSMLDIEIMRTITEMADISVTALKNGGKIVFFGNGGSAADAQHLVTELICRFKYERKALHALALTTNTSNITAIANDFSYDDIFSRQVEALVGGKDIVIGISTSGSSVSVLNGVKKAGELGAVTFGFTGLNGWELRDCTERCLMVPSVDTAGIQEMHIVAGHILCLLIEERFVE